MGVPWRIRQRQLKFPRKSLRHWQCLFAKGGQCSRGAAELQRQILATQRPQSGADAMQCCRVSRKLEPEWHWQCMLHPGAHHYVRFTIPDCRSGKAFDGPVEVRFHRMMAARRPSIVAVSITSWLVAPQCT